MSQYLFKNFAMLDPEHDELRHGHELLVEADRIKEVAAKPIYAPGADSPRPAASLEARSKATQAITLE